MKDNDHTTSLARRRFFRTFGVGAGALAFTGISLGATSGPADAGPVPGAGYRGWLSDSLVADPTKIPAPIHRSHGKHHDLELVIHERIAEIAPGATFRFLTFGGQIPGPMLRIREGDTVRLTLNSPKGNRLVHTIDCHAVYGSGGGAAAMTVKPGQSRSEYFKAMYPGAFIYHCATPDMDMHISRGMFGMMVVEPKEGMPSVDREFYIGQNEVYTRESYGSQGRLRFDYKRLLGEDPSFVLFNGAAKALTGRNAMRARVGETVRVFMVCGGPNLLSSFHPIGNVWTRAWPAGALANPPMRYVQTWPVPPGSTFVGELDLPVPETIKLVDHALTRVIRQGLLAEITVTGPQNPRIYRG